MVEARGKSVLRHIPQAIYWAAIAAGLFAIWWPPRPPMVDLPQHAGQIALLRDLLRHDSAWAGELRINLFTPYLVGYGLALPLAMIVPVVVALKIVLSGAFVAYAQGGVALARRLGAPRALDAYFPLGFLGFAYLWGLYTFLVAAPFGLAFLLVALDYARSPRLAKGIGLAALGSGLFLCHGLIFAFCVAVGGLFLLAHVRTVSALIRRCIPYVILAGICVTYLLVSRSVETGRGGDPGAASIYMGTIKQHLSGIVSYGFDTNTKAWTAGCFLLLVAAPFVLGFRIAWNRLESLAFGIVVAAIVLVAPVEIWTTSLIAQRFALFVLPAIALQFRPAASSESIAPRMIAGLLAIALATTVAMGHQVQRSIRFANESRDFEYVLSAARPNGRALGLVFAQGSDSVDHPYTYLHYPLWYQADRGGFVDFNFAWFLPQVVRFNAFSSDIVRPTFNDRLDAFNWTTDHADRYRYFFVRRQAPLPRDYFKGAPCGVRLVAQRGTWALYEPGVCR